MKKTMKWGIIRSIDVQYGATKTQKIPMVDPATIVDSKAKATRYLEGAWEDNWFKDGKVTRVLHVF